MSMTMTNQKPLLSKFQSFLLLSLSLCGYEPLVMAKELIPVGVVLDLKSPVGRVAERYMSMALSDFYAVNHNYSTRLSLLTKDSGNDVIAAASTALDLMKNEEVQAIIGPQWSAQAKFVIELGRKAQVPIISFSATSPSLSPSHNQFFIRTTQDDCVQVKAIANIVDTFGWREIVLIYEDTDYGNGLIPYLLDALQEIDTRVPYRSVIHPSSNNTEIIKELNKLKENHARIFLVHMTASLGSKLFVRAKEADMMSEGYAWILTTGLSSLLDPMGSKVMDSMQGFRALAIAVEKAGCIVHSSFLKQNASNNNVDLAALGIFEMGSRLRNTILTTKFQGLSGNFDLVKGQLEPSAFELFNVIGRTERIIGHWTRETNLTSNENLSKNQISKDKLKHPIWPGDTPEQPTKLRIGVPVIKEGFLDFVKVEWDPVIVSGFSIDVFEDVIRALPFHLTYEYIPYANETRQSNGTYDQLLGEITLKYDAVIGDITIVARRSLYVDFTLPYTESGVSMVVLEKDDESKNLWIFLKPLSINLWLTTGVAFIFTGLVIWTLEHRVNNDFRGPPEQQLGLIFWFSFSTLAFAQTIFDEIPYIKFYLAKYCSRYTMVGPIYKTGGFGFAFRRGSPLVPYISKAVLNVTQDKHKSLEYEKKYFSSQTTCEDQSTTISSHSPSLGVDSFGGLFIIAGISSLVSLLVYVFKFFYSYWPVLSDDNPADSCWSKLVKMAKQFDLKDLSSYTFKGEESRVRVVASPDVFEPSPGIDDMQNHTRNSTEGSDDVVIHDDNRSLSSSSRHGDASMQDLPNSS
nr:glutamate receptor 2.2 [Quercus suber]